MKNKMKNKFTQIADYEVFVLFFNSDKTEINEK